MLIRRAHALCQPAGQDDRQVLTGIADLGEWLSRTIGLDLKAFGNWRAKFKAEPQPPARKLLWRRGGASHSLSHTRSHSLCHSPSHVTYPSFESSHPIVPPARAGHRRRFSEAERHHILAEAAKPGASVSAVARRYGIARRVLCRWRQEQLATMPSFVDVEIVDAPGTDEEVAA